ncbi:VirB8/TrbF family protein [Pseudomonas sp. SDO528_S397]|jgi:type IV secretion system protein VirB8|uniref:Putative mating pair formation protein n=4 Tax=Gammaproteobacteria TaxID=1236 RepID=Q7X3L1_PSEPU|nr:MULTISPECIES: type IV secretion system protein [Pseudomonas]AAP57233.1 putative mating pair formation protein [Pseudomonas putida]MCH4881219.1 type IV secretion system protein [Pseudomonas sp. TMW22090]QCY09306.1 type IV secretion system protein [Pseudomonas sp. MPC6]
MDKTFKNDEQLRRKALREGQKTKQERNRSFYLNGIQAVAILGLGIAVAALAEIHTVIPVVATIGADGEVLKMRVIDQDNVSSEDALIQGALYDFVGACNTFDPKRKQQLSDACHLFITPDIAREYEQLINPENPDNPYLTLDAKDWIEAQAYGMNKVGDVYQVSFRSYLHKWGTKDPVVTNYVANVKIDNTLKPRALGDRWVNPLGTLATVYRKSEELSRR